jgi:phage-related protein (TIGR01555 family)
LDRWQIAPVINEDALYDYSKATHYQIISGDLIRQPQLVKIHKDRVLRFDGEWLPYRIRQRNYGWGMSTLQSVYDSFRFYSTGISSAATLLTEFDIFVHKLRGLSSMLAAGKEKDVRDRLVLNDMSKSIYRGYAIDAEKEELEFISRNFGGVGEILEKLRIDIIGASQIPHTILFGESPGGLGSTGRSEERDFTKHLGDYQASHYKRPLQHLMKMIMMSKEGPTSGKVPESWRIKFNDLFELNEREKADVRARVAAVDGRYIQLGVLHPQEVADARYGGSEWSMELTLDPSLPRELPQAPGQKAVPPGGRDPLNEENGTLPMDGTREVEDSAGLYLPGDLEHERGEEKEDAEFKDKALHQQAIAAAKSKFKVWPSAVAGAYVTQKYKQLYKSKHGSMEGAFKGKKTTAEYFKKEDAIVPMKVEGLMLGDVDEAAFISDEDIDKAMKEWKEEAPVKFKELLEADNAE